MLLLNLSNLNLTHSRIRSDITMATKKMTSTQTVVNKNYIEKIENQHHAHKQQNGGKPMWSSYMSDF